MCERFVPEHQPAAQRTSCKTKLLFGLTVRSMEYVWCVLSNKAQIPSMMSTFLQPPPRCHSNVLLVNFCWYLLQLCRTKLDMFLMFEGVVAADMDLSSKIHQKHNSRVRLCLRLQQERTGTRFTAQWRTTDAELPLKTPEIQLSLWHELMLMLHAGRQICFKSLYLWKMQRPHRGAARSGGRCRWTTLQHSHG